MSLTESERSVLIQSSTVNSVLGRSKTARKALTTREAADGSTSAVNIRKHRNVSILQHNEEQSSPKLKNFLHRRLRDF